RSRSLHLTTRGLVDKGSLDRNNSSLAAIRSQRLLWVTTHRIGETMKHKALLTILVILSALASVASAAPGPHLSNTDMARLRKLKMPLILPGYIPAGFTVSKVEASPDKRFGSSYRIIYKMGQAELTVQAASGGIGDIIGDYKKNFPFTSSLFGKQEVSWDP